MIVSDIICSVSDKSASVENLRRRIVIDSSYHLTWKKVQLSGIFYPVRPLEEGEHPLYTARIKGSWIYAVSTIKIVE